MACPAASDHGLKRLNPTPRLWLLQTQFVAPIEAAVRAFGPARLAASRQKPLPFAACLFSN
jgi:hypothetical protein